MNDIKNWSPSRLFSYEECPRRTKLGSVQKLCPVCFKGDFLARGAKVCSKCAAPWPASGDALERGTMLHSEAEMYVTGRQTKLHPELKKVSNLLKELRAEYKRDKVRVELELAFDIKWRVVGWRDSDAWLRLKVDVLHRLTNDVARVIDWKTGRFKADGEYDPQLNIYSTCAITAGFAQEATAQLVFTDVGQVVERPFGRVTSATVAKMRTTWEKRVKPMFNDKRFVPKPGGYCRWCDYSRNKGGPCEY